MGAGGKRAWYTLFMLAQFPQEFCDVAMTTFGEAVSFVLCAIGKEGLKLKPEQLQAIHHVYDGKDVFVVAYRVWQVGVLHSPLCSTTSNEAVVAVVLLTVV